MDAPNLRQQSEYYTQRWNAFSYGNNLELRRISAIMDILGRIEYQRIPSICDLGCGPGWTTNILGTFGEALGVDLSDTTRASDRYGHCKFITADILQWQCPEDSFDVVVSMEVIEHIERPLQSKYIDVARRLLKRGGHLILTTPNADTMRAMPDGGREWTNQPVEDWLTASELGELLRINNFRVNGLSSIVSGYGTRGTYRILNSAKLNNVSNMLGLTKKWERWKLHKMFGLHLVVHAQKL